MKLFTRKSVMLFVVIVGIILINNPAWCTDVGGIIDTDTVWDLAGSPYNITATVQIDEGVTLTIDPGVTVNGKSNIWVEVWGTLEAIGIQTEYIEFNDVLIGPRGDNTLIDLEFVHYYGGRPYYGSYRHGGLLLRNSILQDIDFMWFYYPRNDCFIERNVFIRADYWLIRLDSSNIYFKNNVFIESGFIRSSYIINGQVVVEHNSFLSTDRVAVSLDTQSASVMTATNNFWNTTDPAVIESMIYDRNDDLNVYNYIEYIPFLPAPHEDTPSLAFVLANFTANRTSGNYPLAVNFTDQSFGTIETWTWDFGDDTGSEIQNPTHTYIDPGTYTVALTITGPDGTDTQTKTNYITVSEPPEPPPPPKDTDGDGVIDPNDNCINEWNPKQEDSDMDNIGDACDMDELQLQMDEMYLLVESLAEQNESQQTQISELLSAYDSMEQRTQTLESQVTTLTDENENLQTQITMLSNSHTALEEMMQELATQVETVVDENALLTERVTTLEEQVTNHSHSYLTGEGAGHNKTLTSTGPAIFPAALTPVPSNK